MKLLIDSAKTKEIRKLFGLYCADGVTTNPSILAAEGRKPYEVLKEIREIIGKDSELHVQVISEETDEIEKEAERICQILGDKTFVKIPATEKGVAAIKVLSAKGFNITATAVYTTMQAYIAARCGALYVAPYVNRIDNLGGDGVETVKEITSVLAGLGGKTKVLAASFKNVGQLQRLCVAGTDAATVSPEVLNALLKNQSVNEAVKQFESDFAGLCGQNATMLSCGLGDD